MTLASARGGVNTVAYSGAVATLKTPAEAWLDAGLAALADGGPDAVRVEALAGVLGVTKGGFYWHFADRPTFLRQMLDRWERGAVQEVIDEVESHATTALDKLRELSGLAFASSTNGMAVELAVRDWARRDPAVAERLRGVDERRMSYLRSLFSEITEDDLAAEARSFIAYSLFIGSQIIAAGHGERSRDEVVRRALEELRR